MCIACIVKNTRECRTRMQTVESCQVIRKTIFVRLHVEILRARLVSRIANCRRAHALTQIARNTRAHAPSRSHNKIACADADHKLQAIANNAIRRARRLTSFLTAVVNRVKRDAKLKPSLRPIEWRNRSFFEYCEVEKCDFAGGGEWWRVVAAKLMMAAASSSRLIKEGFRRKYF